MGRSPRPWCKHYRGMHLKAECEAGVRFDSLADHRTAAFMQSCPCFGPRGGCDRAEYPTAEELAEEEAAFEKRMEGFGLARAAIVASLGGPWKRGMPGANGVVNCPVCYGDNALRFSRSGYNGHIHAACRTENCVQWME